LTRHELKEQLQHDKFKDSVASVVGYTTSHSSQVIRWTAIGVVAVLIIGAGAWYFSYRSSQRQQDLAAAFQVLGAEVGPANQFEKTYPTADAKQKASIKALSDVIAKDGESSREGLIALYYRGTIKAAQGDKAAESDLEKAADSSSSCAPLAKIALSQLYAGENRLHDAEALLRSIVDKPTSLVSKNQAELLLAQLEQTSNPQDAKQIVKSVKASSKDDSVVARAADQISAELAK
jgi:uncharacterized protein YpmB